MSSLSEAYERYCEDNENPLEFHDWVDEYQMSIAEETIRDREITL